MERSPSRRPFLHRPPSAPAGRRDQAPGERACGGPLPGGGRLQPAGLPVPAAHRPGRRRPGPRRPGPRREVGHDRPQRLPPREPRLGLPPQGRPGVRPDPAPAPGPPHPRQVARSAPRSAARSDTPPPTTRRPGWPRSPAPPAWSGRPDPGAWRRATRPPRASARTAPAPPGPGRRRCSRSASSHSPGPCSGCRPCPEDARGPCHTSHADRAESVSPPCRMSSQVALDDPAKWQSPRRHGKSPRRPGPGPDRPGPPGLDAPQEAGASRRRARRARSDWNSVTRPNGNIRHNEVRNDES